MKIFLVLEGGGSDEVFLGAFTTREIAETFAAEHGEKASVYEYTLDSGYL